MQVLPLFLYPGLQSHTAVPSFTVHSLLASHVTPLHRGSSGITQQREFPLEQEGQCKKIKLPLQKAWK